MPFVYTFPFNSADPANPLATLDHDAEALKRLAQYIKDKPSFGKLVSSFTPQSQDLEEALQQLLAERSVDTAWAKNLDVLGSIVAQAREASVDDDYRKRIKARIQVLRSSATPEEIYTIFTLIKPTGTTLEIVDQPPAAFVLRIHGVTALAEVALLVSFLRASKAAGVRAILEWEPVDAGSLLTLDGGGPGLDDGTLRNAAT